MKRLLLLPAALLAFAACNEGGTTSPDGNAPSFGNFPVSGGVFTSTNPALDDPGTASNHDLCLNAKDSNGPAIDCNIYRAKRFVWLSGGPGPSQLSDGTYMFAVLVPGGQGGNDNPNDCTEKNLSDDPTTALPCTSSNTGAGDTWQHRVFSVASGVITYPAATYPGGHDFDAARNKIRLVPYDNTTNPGGEYVMAVCNLHDATDLASATSTPPGVDPSDCKYDNFKVLAEQPTDGCIIPSECQGTVTADKFYDSNGDGIKQNGEPLITWDLLFDGLNTVTTPVSGLSLFAGLHTVEEGIPTAPALTFWFISHKDVDGGANQIGSPIRLSVATQSDLTMSFTVATGTTTTLLYGNYCTVRPGGRTLGFWSNRNGLALLTTGDFTALSAFYLRNANGSSRDFIGTLAANKTAFNSWLLGASATNMAYMLSVQMSATYLDVTHGFTNGSVIVDGTRTVNDEIAYGNSLLANPIAGGTFAGQNGSVTVAASALRTEQERVKNIFDKINNNGDLGDFRQADVAACGTRTPYSFISQN